MSFEIVQGEKGNITAVPGFQAAGVACGLKTTGNRDLALIYTSNRCTAAGVFTQNRFPAAPVLYDQKALARNPAGIRAVAINSGCANACTGEPGLSNAHQMAKLAGEVLGVAPESVLIMSTGVIGQPLAMEKVAQGIAAAASALSATGGHEAARAIMTTDTRPKAIAVRLALAGRTVTIGGMCKGAGMIHPNMATMLGLVVTDAAVEADLLAQALRQAVSRSFNRITVDGDTSTNDTVLLLANGASGVEVAGHDSLAVFGNALTAVCTELAQMIVRDGEGATKFVELVVTGARAESEALAIAQTIATSALVKTAFAGSDANWGRILAAAGRAGVSFAQDRVALWVSAGQTNSVQLVAGGTPLPYSEAEATFIFSQPEFQVHLDLGQGDEKATVWTCDLTHDYVTINADYRT